MTKENEAVGKTKGKTQMKRKVINSIYGVAVIGMIILGSRNSHEK